MAVSSVDSYMEHKHETTANFFNCRCFFVAGFLWHD